MRVLSEAIPFTTGIRRVRCESVVAFNEIARLTPSGATSFNREARPAVETVIRRGDQPSPQVLLVMRRMASERASKFANGSPIPMNTTFVIRSLGSS